MASDGIAKKEKARGASPLADLVEKVLDPVVAKQGFAGSDVLLHWDDLVGRRIAQIAQPVRVLWPNRSPKRSSQSPMEPATLVVESEGAFALETQHLAPVILERVNAHLGWRAVGRLQIRQGVSRRGMAKRHQAAPSPDSLRKAAQAATGLVESPLRDAIAKLGAAVLSDRTKNPVSD